MEKNKKKIVFRIFGTKIQLLITSLVEEGEGFLFRGTARNGIIYTGYCDREYNHD